jgi:hypothetical protein
MWRPERARTGLVIVGAVGAATIAAWLGFTTFTREPDLLQEVEASDSAEKGDAKNKDAKKDDKPLRKDKRKVSEAERAELITRAKVWRQPAVPVRRASLKGQQLDEVTCKFEVSELGGTTPKFDCELESGEEIRIKYGNGPEVPAEAAATRLLRALGFLADEVTLVRTLRCLGCPEEPFSTMKAVAIAQGEKLYEHVVDYDEFEEFDWVGLERKFEARPVETEKLEGWSFFELPTVDEGKGGAPRAHIDGLRVMAVLLAHWDNKSENQRLVCLTPDWEEDTPCPDPFLLLQDVGATFGPTKLDLAAWEQTPMWEDRRTCTLSMRDLPFEGATFGRVTITEAGRRFIAGLLTQLSDQQLNDLFTGARFAEKRGVFAPSNAVTDWVRVFKQKVHAISAGPACPAA